MSQQRIIVRTREASDSIRMNWTLAPEYEEERDSNHFLVQDPFNLRKAVVPLFRRHSDGTLTGLATAFGIGMKGETGVLLTADHVLSELRESCQKVTQKGHVWHFECSDNDEIVALLSPGLVFGEVALGAEFFPGIASVQTPIRPGQDPMKMLLGALDYDPADISVLHTRPLTAPKAMLHTLTLGPRPDAPHVGDLVVAVGYPTIDTAIEPRSVALAAIREQMFASYGRVVALHPEGRDRVNRTPVFEIEAELPSGMSGGPVFDAEGNVIGIVSRSIAGIEGSLGRGWATWLGHLPELGRMLD